MLLKRVGLPVLVAGMAVLLTANLFGLPSEQLVLAAPAGDVTLSAPLQVPVSLHNIAPGDSGTAGAYRIGYAGNVPAWIGLDADLIGPLAGGASPIVVTISDGKGRYLSKGENQVLGLFKPGEQIDLSVAYTFPIEAGNTYQAQDASLVLQVHAVDSTDNTHFVNGVPMGPVTWSGRIAGTGVTPTENPGTGTPEPCVGEGCAPTTDNQSQPPGTLTPKPVESPPTVVPAPVGTCCDCVRSLLWFGLLYALLLVLAMLAAFFAGWQLRERRIRNRLRALRRSRERTPQAPPPAP